LMQRLANELGFPDTIFLMPGTIPGSLFASKTFTPYEELQICGQGLVGAMNALLDDSDIPDGLHTVETALGPTGVRLERNDTVSVFCSLGRPTVTEPTELEREQIDQLLRTGGIEPGRMAYVDLGRKRLLIQVHLSELGRTAFEAKAVTSTCRNIGITGIVLFSHDNSPTEPVRSRHFTTSLRGAEDAVTGGAAGAILAFCRWTGEPVEQLQIRQGGFVTRGGLMKARVGVPDGEMWIGGNAIKMLESEINL
jgi:PhzF family phenazine biosynthesis protein